MQVQQCAGRPWTVLAYYPSSKIAHRRGPASVPCRSPIALRLVRYSVRSRRKRLFQVVSNLDSDPEENVTGRTSGTKGVKLNFVLHKKCEFGQQFSIVGDHELLGAWNPEASVLMQWSEGHIWTKELELPVGERLEFKVILKTGEELLQWQPGPNLVLETSEALPPSAILVSWSSEEDIQDDVPLGQVVEMNTLLDDEELNKHSKVLLTDMLEGIGVVEGIVPTTLSDRHTSAIPKMPDESSIMYDVVKDIGGVENVTRSTVYGNINGQEINKAKTYNKAVKEVIAIPKATQSTVTADGSQEVLKGEDKANSLADTVSLDIQQDNDTVGYETYSNTVENPVEGEKIISASRSQQRVNGTAVTLSKAPIDRDDTSKDMFSEKTSIGPSDISPFNELLCESVEGDGTMTSGASGEDINEEECDKINMNNREVETYTEVLANGTTSLTVDSVIEKDLKWGHLTLSSLWAALLQRRNNMV